MTTLPASVTIVDLPVGATPTGAELFEAVQTTSGVGQSVQLSLTQMMTLGGLPTGGATGTILNKTSGSNYSTQFSPITTFVAVGTALATTGVNTSIVAFVPNGGITSTQLGANAVVRSNITGLAIGSAQLDTAAVLQANLTAGAVGSTQLGANAVGTAQLATNIGITGTFNATGLAGFAGGISATGLLNQVGTVLITGTFGVVGTAQFTGAFNVAGTTLVTGTLGVIGTTLHTGIVTIVGTTLVTSAPFGVLGTTNLTGAFGLVGTSLVTGTFGVVGTTLFTSNTFGVVGTSTFTSNAFGVVGTALLTATVGVVGTSQFTGAFNVAGTTVVTGTLGVVGTTLFTSGTFGVVGTTQFTSGAFNVAGTATFTSNAFGVVGTSLLTGTFILGSLGAGFLQASATGVVTSGPNAGNFVLINTLSPNNVASTNDTSSFTSTYKTYMITFENICPVTQTTAFQMQVATSGSNFVSGSYLSQVEVLNQSLNTFEYSTTVLMLSGAKSTTSLQTALAYGLSGFIKLFNPASVVSHKQIVGELSCLVSNGAPSTTTMCQVYPNGWYDGAVSPVTGVNFLFSSGNIQTGTIKIYGMT